MKIRNIVPAVVMGLTIPVLTAFPSFAANYAVSDPSGTLLETATLTIPLNSSEFKVRGSDQINLGGVDNCQISAGLHVYDVQSIDITIEGDYTFRTIATSANQTSTYPSTWHAQYNEGFTDMHPIEDSFIAIYSNGFNPRNPNSSVVGCNDDSNEYWDVVDANDGGVIAVESWDNHYVNTASASAPFTVGTWAWGTDEITVNGDPVSVHMPVFSSHLTPGHYTAVITVWEPMSAESWAAGDDHDQFTWTAGPASVETQIWGPAGGASLSETPWEPVSDSGGGVTKGTLAFTGVEGVTESATIAFLAMVAGIFIVLRRRKKIAS